MARQSFGLGIDFGTSNTVAMLRWPDGRVKPLLFDASSLLPTAVFAPPVGDLVVGSDALHHARFTPAGLEPNPKLHIDERAVLLGAREVPIVDLFAAVLRRVFNEAVRVTNGITPSVALAHPAGWGSARRQILADAAAAAGIENLTLVPEPAAAANYFTTILEQDLPAGAALVVYDLGAGTFDASIVVRRPQGFEVVAVDGVDDVGGLDIDEAIVNWLREQHGARQPELWQRLSTPHDDDDRRVRHTLWNDVRTAKEMLSRAPAVLLRLTAPLDIDTQLSRAEFESIAEPFIARTVRTTTGLIRHAGLRPSEIQAVLLVGGGSRIPLVATALHRQLGIAPTVTEQPETVVSEGTLQTLPSGPASPGAHRASAKVRAAGKIYRKGEFPLDDPPALVTAPLSPAQQSRVIPVWHEPPFSDQKANSPRTRPARVRASQRPIRNATPSGPRPRKDGRRRTATLLPLALAALLAAGTLAAVMHSGTGRTTVAVPRLVDHNATEAEGLLNEQELIGDPSTASRDGCAANMVFQQGTTAGARVAKGTHVRYAVCAASQPIQRIVVPNGVGMNYQQAQDLWRGAGLHVAPAVDATGAHRLPIIDSNWVVLRQSPPAGTTVDTGTFITATVKKYTDS